MISAESMNWIPGSPPGIAAGKEKSTRLSMYLKMTFRQMLTVRPYSGGQGTVDSYWNPLSPEHGLPRNLVFVIILF